MANLITDPLSTIGYSDVEGFCKSSPAPTEGSILELKGMELPSDPKKLPRIMAAFANHLGGTMLIGVDGDSANRPIWPPCGIDPKGIPERLQQAANAATPPVNFDLSEAIAVPDQPGRVVYVVRIRESLDAPHATDDGRTIYVRTGPIGTIKREGGQLAEMHRLAEMFRLRDRHESRADSIVARLRDRAYALMPFRSLGPINVPVFLYLAVMPELPARTFTTLSGVAKAMDPTEQTPFSSTPDAITYMGGAVTLIKSVHSMTPAGISFVGIMAEPVENAAAKTSTPLHARDRGHHPGQMPLQLVDSATIADVTFNAAQNLSQLFVGTGMASPPTFRATFGVRHMEARSFADSWMIGAGGGGKRYVADEVEHTFTVSTAIEQLSDTLHKRLRGYLDLGNPID